MTNKVYYRHNNEDRLVVTIAKKSEIFGFSFTTRGPECSIDGYINVGKLSGPTQLSHSSGVYTNSSHGLFMSMEALFSRLQTLAASELTDEQVHEDSQVQLILKNNSWKEYVDED